MWLEPNGAIEGLARHLQTLNMPVGASALVHACMPNTCINNVLECLKRSHTACSTHMQCHTHLRTRTHSHTCVSVHNVVRTLFTLCVLTTASACSGGLPVVLGRRSG